MTENLKNLIESAPIKNGGKFQEFLIISNGVYDGFWGQNGFNNIIILAREKVSKGKYYKLCDTADKFTVFNIADNETFNLDIPSEYGVPRIWFNNPIEINYPAPISDLVGYMS